MYYVELVKEYELLEGTTKRLQKTYLLSEFLKLVHEVDLEIVMLLLQGRIFPSWDEREIGIASRILIKALGISTGFSEEEIEHLWKEKGDIGLVTEHCISVKKQKSFFSEKLTIQKVFSNLQKLAQLEGEGTVNKKIGLLSELLTNAEAKEGKYVVRTVLGDLRIGLGEGTLRDSIVWAYLFNAPYDKNTNEFLIDDEKREIYNSIVTKTQETFDVINDFSSLAVICKTKGICGLDDVSIIVGKPIKVMLYQKAKNLADAFETVGKPAALEYKYDGFRILIHKKGKDIWIFTRRLENVTKQFPDVVEVIKEIEAESYILDAEAVGYDPLTRKYLPFQMISQRIKRKYDIEEMSRKFPVEVNVFDILYFNGESLLKKSFEERRGVMEKFVKQNSNLKIAKQIITSDDVEAEKFYKDSLLAGCEGIMVKNLLGLYKPGSRVGYGLKIKPTMETLDVVIVGGEWGEGKRSSWLSSFVIAVRDENGGFFEIGRVGTGIKEKDEEGMSFGKLTEMLKPLIVTEKGKEVKVKPSLIVEVDYEEIQKSPTYSSGYALRFPRFVRVRQDKSVDEITTLEQLKKMFEGQG